MLVVASGSVSSTCACGQERSLREASEGRRKADIDEIVGLRERDNQIRLHNQQMLSDHKRQKEQIDNLVGKVRFGASMSDDVS